MKRMMLALAALGLAACVPQEKPTGAEDFAFYQQVVPGVFYDLGIGFPPGVNHSPLFNVMDEKALEVGVRAQALMALDYLRGPAPAR